MIYIYFLIIYYIGTTDYIQLVSSTHPIPLSIECKWALMGGKQVERLKVPRKYVSMYTYCGHTCMYVCTFTCTMYVCLTLIDELMNCAWCFYRYVSTGMFMNCWMCASFVNVCNEAQGTSNLGYLMHVQLVLVLVSLGNQRNNCCAKYQVAKRILMTSRNVISIVPKVTWCVFKNCVPR